MSNDQAALATRTPVSTPQEPSVPLNGTASAEEASRAGRLDVPRSPASSAAPETLRAASPLDVLAYQRDVLERSILFFDTLRKRANIVLEHEYAGLPAVLNFASEMILDARQFEPPANYALLRIVEVGDMCWDDCVDPDKPPVIVIDPRAGHGPGIGGFKRDSEVGIALHVGHPVYFVIFFPDPCPGQTLGDVLAALRRFVEHVASLHPAHPPLLYGNCQAGWA